MKINYSLLTTLKTISPRGTRLRNEFDGALEVLQKKGTTLPNPNGTLVEDVPSTSTAIANCKVKPFLENFR